jgi:hypothetical protein
VPLVVAKEREADLLELRAYFEGAGAVVAGSRDLVAEFLEPPVQPVVGVRELGCLADAGAVEDDRHLVAVLVELVSG